MEAWYLTFSRTIGLNQPPIYIFIDKLRKEQAQQEIITIQLAAGAPTPERRRRYDRRNVRLLAVLASYQSENKLWFLKNVAANVEISV